METTNLGLSILNDLKSTGIKTIDEAIVLYKEKIEKEYQDENDKLNSLNKWYKDLQGRYFIINFNGTTGIAFYVDKYPDTNFDNIYEVFNINWKQHTLVKENRKVNRYWFNNPYEKNYIGQGNEKVIELTKEEYDEIKYCYLQQETFFKTCKTLDKK